ncbi:MAG: hypothetical protein KDI12_24445, partial [Anaerolineae bacterium]|nr:hypothetical protein [Anaerolineae bacterium]
RVDLILYGAVSGPTGGHAALLSRRATAYRPNARRSIARHLRMPPTGDLVRHWSELVDVPTP